ncbi:MAG: alpha/beta hydrolase [Myxococcota bacterium]
MTVMNTEWIGDASAEQVMVFCHGILGSGRNWRSFARQMIARHPHWRALLVDLRNHGDSPAMPGPHTVAACADDLARLAEQVGTFDAVIGHSFGGKVALAYADQRPPDLHQVWSLDADPGPLEGPFEEMEVPQVIAALRTVPMPIARREDLVTHLTGQGLSMPLARWMTTNVRRADGGLVWAFDLDGVEAMITDYATLDLWSVLDVPIADLEIHVLHALNSDRWSTAMVQRARYAAAATTHALPEAGHWVHVDNPEGLLRLMSPYFD